MTDLEFQLENFMLYCSSKNLSRKTLQSYEQTLKLFFMCLQEHFESEIPKNPIEKIENPKVDRKLKMILTPEEIKKVLGQFKKETFHGYRNYVITRLLLDTGMRIGECLALQPNTVDFKHKSIHIKNPKNSQERYVYFSFKSASEIKHGCSTEIVIRIRHIYSQPLVGQNLKSVILKEQYVKQGEELVYIFTQTN